MYSGPALYKGKVGSTGVSTGPHAHFTLTKDGKEIPLSIARKDIGQYLQFRLPGKEDWQSVYSPENQGFRLNPGTQITSPMGKRVAPTAGASTYHRGEDYAFPEGTSLRFLGQGSISTHAGLGNAGNVSVLRTGPYELQTFHLSELPQASTTRGKETSTRSTETATKEEDAKDFLNAYINDYVEAGLLQGLLMPQKRSDPMAKFQQMYQQFVQPGIVNPLLS